MFVNLIGGAEIAITETARIVETHMKAVIENKADMIVFLQRQIIARYHHAPRHAQMQKQSRVVIKIDQNIFRAPFDIQNFTAFEFRAKIGGQRRAQICAMRGGCRDACAGQRFGEASADCFDFGEFGHRLLDARLL